MSAVQSRRVSETRTARKRRKKAFYNSRDSVGFVFHKVSSDEARDAGLDATFAVSSTPHQEPMHEVKVEAVRESLDHKPPVEGVSCGGVASSGAEGKPVVEDVEAYVAAQLNDEETCQLHLKQFESEMLAAKLLKEWIKVHPEADQDAVEERRKQWTIAILSSEVHWMYYSNEERDHVGECERLEQGIDLMRKEESEWKRALQIHTDEIGTKEGWEGDQLTGTQGGGPTADLAKYDLQHTREVIRGLDKGYTQLLGAMSERCEEYEDQLLTDEAKLKVRYDEAATPYTLLSKAQHVATRLDSYK